MKEQIEITEKAEIKWPQGNKIEVGSDVDFIYIMRKDGKFAMPPIAQKMAADFQLNEEVLTQKLLEEYDTFFEKLADIFQWAYSSKGNFELHLFDPDTLDSQVRLKSSGQPIVSLDPLMNQGVQEFGVSRGYFMGGTKDFGQVARPGHNTLSGQSHDIALSVNGQHVVVSEDDIFSGGSVIASLNALLESGVVINKIIPGIQIGKPKKLSDMGLSVDPVIEYQTIDGADIFSKLDLGDPRDYLLGASGLVIKLPSGEFGRAPYILPFVSTTARAGIPAEIEKEFALKVLQANIEFFNAVKDKTGNLVLLEHMDHNFLVYMHQMYGVDPSAEMAQITAWLMENIDGFWEATKKQGEFQEKLASLKLPQDIVFLDVNGTLFPDDSINGHISDNDILLLNQAIITLKSKGLAVGLCSDSPLPQLQEFAKNIGADGPIIAENGNIVFNNNQTLTLNALPEIETYKSQVIEQAQMLGLQQAEDCIAPEFGGKQVDVNNSQWSFGANRNTSVTVFGPPQLVVSLGECFGDNQGLSIDCSPEYNFFAIHPGENYKQNKGYTLSTLSAYGHKIIMVGNGMSDWVEPEHEVVCAFVSGARITEAAKNKAGYISDKSTVKGVIDILEKIL